MRIRCPLLCQNELTIQIDWKVYSPDYITIFHRIDCDYCLFFLFQSSIVLHLLAISFTFASRSYMYTNDLCFLFFFEWLYHCMWVFATIDGFEAFQTLLLKKHQPDAPLELVKVDTVVNHVYCSVLNCHNTFI